MAKGAVAKVRQAKEATTMGQRRSRNPYLMLQRSSMFTRVCLLALACSCLTFRRCSICVHGVSLPAVTHCMRLPLRMAGQCTSPGSGHTQGG